MEITDFLSKNFLSSFTGTLIAVELIVFVTKDIYLIKKKSLQKIGTGC